MRPPLPISKTWPGLIKQSPYLGMHPHVAGALSCVNAHLLLRLASQITIRTKSNSVNAVIFKQPGLGFRVNAMLLHHIARIYTQAKNSRRAHWNHSVHEPTCNVMCGSVFMNVSREDK